MKILQQKNALTPARYSAGKLMLGILAGFVLTGSGWALIVAAADPSVVYPRAKRLLSLEEQMRGVAHAPRVELLLGDSLTYESGAVKAVATHLRDWQEPAKSDDQKVRLVNVSTMGFDIYSHYLISDLVGDIEPRRVLIAVNLGLWSRNKGQQPELAALLSAGRWIETLFLPLHEAGVTMGDLLTNRLVYVSGGFGLLAKVQAGQIRLQRETDALSKRINSRAGTEGLAALRQRRHDQGMLLLRRPDKELAQQTFAPILDGLAPGDGRLMVLEATVRHFRGKGARVLVFVQPINHEHLTKIGVYDKARIDASTEQIREVADRQNASFLDLHALLPDAAFRDSGNHLAYRDPTKPAEQVAKKLQPWLEDERRDDSEGSSQSETFY